MDWDKQVTRRVMEAAGDSPGVMLQFLLTRLEQYHEAGPSIAEAMQDLSGWYEGQAKAFGAEVARREASAKLREIVNTTQK